MTRELCQIQYFERRGSLFKSHRRHFFFLLSFALVILFLFKIKPNAAIAFVESRPTPKINHFLTDQELHISGGKSWVGCLADFTKHEQLDDLESFSKHSFVSKVEGFYRENISDVIRRQISNPCQATVGVCFNCMVPPPRQTYK